MNVGKLIVSVYVDSIANPIKNASVRIIGDNYDQEFTTDLNGKTSEIELKSVNRDYSLIEQDEIIPFKSYNLVIKKNGLCTKMLYGVEIYSGELAYQDVFLNSVDNECTNDSQEIDTITLWGEYSPHKVEGLLFNPYVLNKIVIPEYIIVHDGNPGNTAAPNYTVNFIDYIKNVACSEIYSTWPKETIKANIIAIISFALNRTYSEWYRSKGYNFTITSTTTYDQKYTRGRTLFDSITKIVDEIFDNYIIRNNSEAPLLAQYRANTTLEGVMSQWGSKELGDKGYSAINILKYYYGDEINLKKAPFETGLVESFKGVTLKLGDCNEDVYLIQNQLNYIRGSYPGIPVIRNANGNFDDDTKKAVSKFQQVFNLTNNGEVNYSTWYKISYIYIAVSKMIQSIYN